MTARRAGGVRSESGASGEGAAKGAAQGGATTLTSRMLAAWRDPGASWRAEWRADPPESRLLAIAFGAAAFLTLGPVAAEAIRPTLVAGAERAPWFAARLFIGFSFLPLALYLAAAVIALICRACGGEVPADTPDTPSRWRAVRLAFFWSAFASGPFAALAHALTAFFGVGGGGFVAGLAWLWLLSPMLAAAQGFAPRRVAATLAVVALAGALLAFLTAPVAPA